MAGKFHYTVSHNFCAVEADTVDELKDLLFELVNDEDIAGLIAGFRESVGGRGTNPATSGVPLAKEVLGGTEITEEPEEVKDKWGKVFVYNHPEAPDLPDGRGKYILMKAKSKEGKAYQKWVDPLKGPKPAKPSDDGEKAEDIWA